MPKKVPNPCAKRVTPEEAYEVYGDEYSTTWVLKKYKNPLEEEKDRYAKWYIASRSAGTFGSYEYGDCYAANIKNNYPEIDNPLASYTCVRLDDQTTFTLNMLLHYRYQDLRVKDPILVNYMRLAVPKGKLEVFKKLAAEHKLVIVCIDVQDYVQQCLNDFHNERIRQDQEGRQQYLLEQAKLREQYND